MTAKILSEIRNLKRGRKFFKYKKTIARDWDEYREKSGDLRQKVNNQIHKLQYERLLMLAEKGLVYTKPKEDIKEKYKVLKHVNENTRRKKQLERV